MSRLLSLTIGIPVYNEEANISELLSRLLSQKEVGFKINKIIVISDGSTDSTVERVKEIADPRVALITYKDRKGPHERLNEILGNLPSKTDAFLPFEGDWLPQGDSYIANLFKAIPADGIYSIVMGVSRPTEPTSYINSVMNFGFYLRNDIFETAASWPNLYLFSMGVLSKKFFEMFRWDPNFHDDSFCFRKAVESGLPLVRSEDSTVLFKTVGSIKDYLLQSGKFVKARKSEETQSNIYRPEINLRKAIFIVFKHFVKQPLLFCSYISLLCIGRICSVFLPEYTSRWQVYYSSKNLNS